MYSVILIVTLIVISGIIAYIGDSTGFRIGKKKISIFGWRPHRTAVFITILTGIIISILTITVLSLLSYDVRTALFGLDELRERQQQLTMEIEDRNRSLHETRGELEEKIEELAEMDDKFQQLTLQIKLQTEELDSLSETKAKLTEVKNELEKEISELQETVKALYSGISWLRSGDIIFDQGEEISQTIIKGGLEEQEIEYELMSLLNQATRKVLAMGAKADENSGQVLIISKREYEELVQRIQQSETELVVRLLALMNVIKGEVVIGTFSTTENKLVFEKDEVVFNEEIPQINDPDEAENILFSILRKVNLKAVQEGIIPEPKTSLVGTISAVNLFEVVRNIVQSDTGMKIKVISLSDTWTTGPFKIRMEAEKVVH